MRLVNFIMEMELFFEIASCRLLGLGARAELILFVVDLCH
jgi:hypothetical protein